MRRQRPGDADAQQGDGPEGRDRTFKAKAVFEERPRLGQPRAEIPARGLDRRSWPGHDVVARVALLSWSVCRMSSGVASWRLSLCVMSDLPSAVLGRRRPAGRAKSSHPPLQRHAQFFPRTINPCLDRLRRRTHRHRDLRLGQLLVFK